MEYGVTEGLRSTVCHNFKTWTITAPKSAKSEAQGHDLVRFHRSSPLITMQVTGSMLSNPRLRRTSSLNPYQISGGSC